MENFNLKNHNKKVAAFAKKAASGAYPSPRVAKTGSFFGTAIGTILAIIGSAALITGSPWGLGSLLAGLIAVVSNILNIIRINKYIA